MPKETIKQYQHRVAKSGGDKTFAKYGRKYMKKISKKGVVARRKPKEGLLKKYLYRYTVSNKIIILMNYGITTYLQDLR